MSIISGTVCLLTMLVLSISTGALFAAENRVPTPEEFREAVRQYNQSGKVIDLQRSRQVPKAVEQFNRALSLHTKKEASTRDLKEAASLYQESFEGGVPQAATNLALLYLEGKGVKKDVKKALSLLNAASAKNDSQADIALARLYLNGTDVKKDEKKAEALLNKAAKAGNQNGVKMLAEYKDWKKKNELAMKQYQDLMKQVQSAQNKQGAVPQPLQIFPQSSRSIDSRLPVIPGSSYLTALQASMPSFIDSLPQQPPIFKVVPDGDAGFQTDKVQPALQTKTKPAVQLQPQVPVNPLPP